MTTMETSKEIQDKIRNEIIQEDIEVRENFLKHFSSHVDEFTFEMAKTFQNWRSFDATIKGEKDKAAVSAVLYSAIALHIASMKLMLSGNIIAAGNSQRQVIESIAMAFLCSGKSLDVLKRFMNQQYSPNKAIRDVIKHSANLNLNTDALKVLKKSYEFYHNYSHLTYMTIASFVSFSEVGLYVGSSFDEEKLSDYKNEIELRVSLARTFSNVVDGVKTNVSKWGKT